MNYELFCYILNDNLAYQFSDFVSPDIRLEYQHEWYIMFRQTRDHSLPHKEQVIQWMRDHFSECSFDTHSFCLKIRSEWQSADIKPPENLGVLVYIPDEDGHITSGMWDVSQAWVLLDENRVPECAVTHWQLLPEPPTMP